MYLSLRLSILASFVFGAAVAWSNPQPPISRRNWMNRLVVESSSLIVAGTTVAAVGGSRPAWAATDVDKAIGELEQSIEKMKPIPE